VHTSATAGVTGGRLLRRASTSAERARDAQHDAAEALRWLGWAEKARSSEHCGRCELGPSAMADAAAFSRCRARARQERMPGRSGELAIHSGGQAHASVWSRELGTRCPCMVDTHWTRVTRCDISSITWRAATWLEWDAYLGSVWADLDFGPKTKVAVLGPLYISCLRFTTIRVTD
jgi:hypothetical protein